MRHFCVLLFPFFSLYTGHVYFHIGTNKKRNIVVGLSVFTGLYAIVLIPSDEVGRKREDICAFYGFF